MTIQSPIAAKNQVQNTGWQQVLPAKHTLQKGLLGISAATAVLSLFPPFRLAGALATRSAAAVSSTIDCIDTRRLNDQTGPLARNYAKIATIALGVLGLAAASPFLIAASLAADIAIQAFDSYKSVPSQGVKAFMHLTFMTIDSLALGAFLAGSWPLMAAAAGISALAMGVFALSCAIDDDRPSGTFESLCYFTLFATSLASLGASLKLTATVKQNSSFSITNISAGKQTIYDANNKALGTVEPGDTLQIEVPYKSTLKHLGFVALPSSGGSQSIVPHKYGSYLKGIAFNEANDMTITNYDAVNISTVEIVNKSPLASEHFPTLPVGGNVLIELD